MDIKKIKNYEVNSNLIGKGYGGKVYLARDINNNKVAIKEISDIKLAKHEAFVMKQYGAHKFLPKLYDFFIIENKAYIVMEYFPGETIGPFDFRAPRDKKSEKEAIIITFNLLQGLQHLHQTGFAHNDILPKNILIMDDNPNKIKLIDFGIAKPLESKKNQKYKNRDLHLTALTCLYLINGRVSNTAVSDLESIKNSNLKNILYQGIHPNSKKRYYSTDKFIEDLKPLVFTKNIS